MCLLISPGYTGSAQHLINTNFRLFKFIHVPPLIHPLQSLSQVVAAILAAEAVGRHISACKSYISHVGEESQSQSQGREGHD
jgi:hypothetical protein